MKPKYGTPPIEAEPIHRRNIAAELEAPIAPSGIVDGAGRVYPGTVPAPRRPITTYGTPAEPRADLEL